MAREVEPCNPGARSQKPERTLSVPSYVGEAHILRAKPGSDGRREPVQRVLRVGELEVTEEGALSRLAPAAADSCSGQEGRATVMVVLEDFLEDFVGEVVDGGHRFAALGFCEREVMH